MKKIKVSKTMMYQLVKKHSVYKLPRMGKSVKATYDAAEAFKDLVRIECKADQYDQVLHF